MGQAGTSSYGVGSTAQRLAFIRSGRTNTSFRLGPAGCLHTASSVLPGYSFGLVVIQPSTLQNVFVRDGKRYLADGASESPSWKILD